MQDAETETAAGQTDSPPVTEEKTEFVSQLIGRRLRHQDVRAILDRLGQDDRDAFTGKLTDILHKTSALLEVSRSVSDSLSLDVLLPRMVQIVSEFLEADRSTLFLNDKHNRELHSRVAQGDLTEEIRFPNHLGIAGTVFTSTEAVIIDDAYADARFNPAVDKKTGYKTRNILCAPIRTPLGDVIGVAQVLNKKTGDFDSDDLELLEAITGQAASAFVNAQLHEQIHRSQREENKLLEITTAISRELHLEPLLGKIMDAATEILDADRSTLFMHDSKTQELWSHVAQGDLTQEIRFPAHLGIAGSVFTSENTINIPDAYADERFNPAFDKKTGYKTDTILCMPVINKQDVTIGVVQVLNKKDGPFTEVDEARLRAFSSQASIAIENAQLFEEIMSIKNYNESILESMSNGVITLDAEQHIVTANEAALRIFRRESTPEDLLSKAASEVFCGKNDWVLKSVEKVEQSRESDVALDVDLWLRQPDQDEPSVPDERRRESASVNLTVVPLHGGKGENFGSLIVIEDITNEKRLRGTMARYMTKELADKLLEEGEAVLGGKVQTATVLFTDIRSFTSIAERIGAQETVQMLNEYFSIMVDIIMENGGILDKYIGDAIMAVFGAPFPTPQDPDNAVKTAIGMIQSLRQFNATRREVGKEEIAMGIGVNTDEVLSGNIGSLKRMDYTVIGDGVNLAARLEGANKPYGTQILISQMTADLLEGHYRLREVDRIRVKGKKEPVAVVEVMDYHDDETFPNIDDTLYLYQSGLVYYRQQHWQKAENIFHDALLLNPGDGLSEMYRDRCVHFAKNPPEEDWDGVWTMTSK